MLIRSFASLVNLNRPTAYHNDPNLPSHTFRPGDPAKILPQESVRSKAKTKKVVGGGGEDEKEVEGVVYKVRSFQVNIVRFGMSRTDELLNWFRIG
jgi:hypothetical protein